MYQRVAWEMSAGATVHHVKGSRANGFSQISGALLLELHPDVPEESLGLFLLMTSAEPVSTACEGTDLVRNLDNRVDLDIVVPAKSVSRRQAVHFRCRQLTGSKDPGA